MFARFWSTSDHATTSLQSSIPTCRAWSREVSSSLCVFSRRRDPPATRSRRRTTAGRRSKRAHRATNMPDSMPSPPIRVLSFLGATSTSFVHTTCTADCRTFLWGGTGEPIYDADRLCWCSCDSDKWSDVNILGHPSCVPMAAHLTYGWIGLVVSVAALLHAAFHLRRQVITHKQGLVGFQVGYCTGPQRPKQVGSVQTNPNRMYEQHSRCCSPGFLRRRVSPVGATDSGKSSHPTGGFRYPAALVYTTPRRETSAAHS